ncbi:MAG: hypothetical protein ACMZ64_06910 [Oleiphilus sp.]
MKLYQKLLAVCLAATAFSTQAAQLAGKNVLLIQGFLPQHLIANPSDNGKAASDNYWSTFDASLKNSGNSNVLHYPSNERIEGSGGIASIVAAQLNPILSSGYCDNQCVVITHSTGDLVMRYVMANKNSLLGSSLANRLKVAAIIDMAGAGGGTELAALGVDIINGVNHGTDVIEALLDWAGFNFELGINPGVMHNLQPSIARNTATTNIPSIPRLRIASTGDELYGFITHPFIKGKDDSVVPLHSACGSAYPDAYDSCMRDLRIDGRVTSVSKAPSSSQLYNYHYPVIMSESMPHNSMQANHKGHDMTFALTSANRYGSSSAKTIDIDVEYYHIYAWWDWYNKYRYISNASNKNMGQVILASFE